MAGPGNPPAFHLAHHLDHEIPIRCRAHQLAPIIGPARKQVPEPRPALAGRPDGLLSPLGILQVGGREIDHQKPPVRVHHDVALSPLHLLGRIIAAPAQSGWRFHALAVDHPS